MTAAEILIHSQQSATPLEIVADYADNLFILDYGIVRNVNADDTVNVRHAKRLSLKTGEYLPEAVTEDVEVLWPSVAGFSFRAPIEEGDRVLLVGLKNFLPTVDIEDSSEQTVFYAYSRETLKALPLCLFNSEADVVITVEDGDLHVDATAGQVRIKNTTRNLKLLVDELVDNLTTLSAAIATNGSPLWPSGATVFPALKAKFAQLLKE